MSNKPKPGYKTTEIGEIPEDWRVVEVSDKDITRKIRAGGTPLRTKKEYYETGTIPFVRIEDITKAKKFLYETESKIAQAGLDNSSAWLVPKNSILFSMYASYGEVAINTIPVATNQAIVAIIPNEISDVEFFYYVLANLKPKLRKYLKETTQKNLTAEIVRNIKMPLPSHLERKKITEILSTADKAIQKTDQIIQRTQMLKKGLVQQLLTQGIGHTMFKHTEIGQIPEEWALEDCAHVCSEITVGIVVTPAKYYQDSGVPCLRSLNVWENQINSNNLVYISPEANQLHKKSILQAGDVVIVRSGYPGTAAVVPETFDGCNCIDLIIARPNERIDPQFLTRFINSQAAKRQIFSWQGGSAQLHFNVEVTKRLRIPIPPKQEQKHIVRILSACEKVIEKEKQRKEQLEKLKKGLLQDLLTGRARVKVN